MAQYQVEQDTIPTTKGFLAGIEHIFKKMSGISEKIETPQKEDPKEIINPEILVQQNLANQFLNTELFDQYFNMLANGYIPTSQQNNFWKNKIDSAIQSHKKTDEKETTEQINQQTLEQIFETFKQFAQWKKGGIKFSEDQYIEMLFSRLSYGIEPMLNQNLKRWGTNNTFFICETMQWVSPENTNPLIKNFSECALQNSFSDKLYKKFEHVINKAVTANWQHANEASFLNPLIYSITTLDIMPNICFKNVKIDEYMTLLNLWQNAYPYRRIPEFGESFKDVVNVFYSKQVQEILLTTKKVFSEQYFSQIAQESLQKIDNSFVKDVLPENTKTILEDIQRQQEILTSLKLTDEQKFTINNLITKHIPEVLEQYFRMTPEYRTSLKNIEGKSAENLMTEALNNFKQKIETIIEDSNTLSLNDLSVKKRYSKTI